MSKAQQPFKKGEKPQPINQTNKKKLHLDGHRLVFAPLDRIVYCTFI